MNQVDPKIEVVHRLCDDLTKDIQDVTNKQWLLPAIVSHVTHLLGSKEDIIHNRVNAWYHKKVKEEK